MSPKNFCALTLATVVAFAAMTGCAKGPRVHPDDIPVEEKAALELQPGMSRTAVERVLGIPVHFTETKDGNAFVHYSIGDEMRAVQYDSRDRVVAVYP